MLKGEVLVPHKPYRLRSGDAVVLGDMNAVFVLLEDANATAVMLESASISKEDLRVPETPEKAEREVDADPVVFVTPPVSVRRLACCCFCVLV